MNAPRTPQGPRNEPPKPSRFSDESIGLQLVLALLLIAAVAAALSWLGAQLASLVVLRGPLHVGLPDALDAVVAMRRHLEDPRTAWPLDVRDQLPGPIVYWLCTAFSTLTIVAAASTLFVAWRRHRRYRGTPFGVDPNRGLAQPRDLRRLAVRTPQSNRLTLGYAGHQLIAAEPRVSLAVIGPTGCGKTAGFAIPALLEWRGPIIATSTKSDLIDATLEHRRRRGHAWIFDPSGSSGQKTDTWSPLAVCRTWAGALRVAAWLCEVAEVRTSSVTDGDYWSLQARKALAPYVHAAALGGRTLQDVMRWVDGQEAVEVEEILRRHARLDRTLERRLKTDGAQQRRDALRTEIHEREIDALRKQATLRNKQQARALSQAVAEWPIEQQRLLEERTALAVEQQLRAELGADVTTRARERGRLDALIAGQSLWRKDAKLRGSVYAGIENVLATYADPGVGRATRRKGIDVAKWLEGDNTIYIASSAHEQKRLRPVFTLFVQEAVRAAYDAANARGGTLQHSCLVLLDEAGNIAPLRDLPSYTSTARSHGITFVSVWQDSAQIRSIYRDRAPTVLNNHQAKLFGAGIADDTTLEYVSRLIGDERRTELNVSNDVRGGRRTVSEHVNYRRLAPMDVVRRIPTNEAVLIYGNQLPAHLRLRPWFSRKHVSAFAPSLALFGGMTPHSSELSVTEEDRIAKTLDQLPHGRVTPTQQSGLDTLANLAQTPDGAALIVQVAAWRGARRDGEEAELAAASAGHAGALTKAVRALLKAEQVLVPPRVSIGDREFLVGDMVTLQRGAQPTRDVDTRDLPPPGVLGTIEAIDLTRGHLDIDFPIAGRHRVAIGSHAARALTHGYVDVDEPLRQLTLLNLATPRRSRPVETGGSR